jgi:GNAT superfamily N-acetyltransferase
MGEQIEIIDVNKENVSETGFFCCMSKRKTEGYQRKLKWITDRFYEGMRLKMIKEGGRGFVEYIPGEYAWRAVNAEGYMVIHCLWVVGKSKGKGCGSFLLDRCLSDAKKSGMRGVAMVTSEGNWLTGKKLLLKKGFESVDHASPSFDLMVKKFGKTPDPSFVGDWDSKLKRCGQGITIFRSDQCPYLDDAVNILAEAAEEVGIQSRVLELRDSQSVRDMLPSPYGVFSVVLDGALLSYHYLLKKDFLKALARLRK